MNRFIVVVNRRIEKKDTAWMRKHLAGDAVMEDRTEELSLIAFQGSSGSCAAAAGLFGHEDIPYFGFRSGQVAGAPALISRTGYTGEDGFDSS